MLLLSRIGYVQLALGHVGPAEASFARAAAIAATPAYGTDKEVQAAVRRNQGLLLTAHQDYKGIACCSHALFSPSPSLSVPDDPSSLQTAVSFMQGSKARLDMPLCDSKCAMDAAVGGLDTDFGMGSLFRGV